MTIFLKNISHHQKNARKNYFSIFFLVDTALSINKIHHQFCPTARQLADFALIKH